MADNPAAHGDAQPPEGTSPERADLSLILLLSVFVVATCGLVYELLAGTIASYLLGDSVTQFSTVIGAYLFAMGIGSWFSRHVKSNYLGWFIRVEILIALIGGASGAVLFHMFTVIDDFRPLLYSIVFIIGFLVGLEIPLLIRILRGRYSFGDLVSNVLTYDYIGALAASLMFPLILVPYVGLIRGGFVVGLANIAVALLLLWRLRGERRLLADRIMAIMVAVVLALGAVFADQLQRLTEERVYDEPIVYSSSSQYQRIVVTRRRDDLRLYLSGNLQFSSRDEYRYHEALVWPGLGRIAEPRRVLIMGGGDGLALREVLKHPRVEEVTLVDLDPAITQLFRDAPALARLNGQAFEDERVEIVNADAFGWVRGPRGQYDFVVLDFPDPTNLSIGKLYSREFYTMLSRLVSDDGIVTVQSTAPFVARTSFWTISQTLEAAGFQTRPYHAYVPSFGDWGFTMAYRTAPDDLTWLPEDLRFIDAATEREMYNFPADLRRREAAVNRLDNQALVRSFTDEWTRYDP